MPSFWKQCLAPAIYVTRSGPVEVTAADVNEFYRNGKDMIAAGVPIPVPLEHQPEIEKLSREQLLAYSTSHNTGFVEDYDLRPDGTLWAKLGVNWLPDAKDDAEIEHRLKKSIRFVSPRLAGDFQDGTGRSWRGITHVALTPIPVWHGQLPFGSDSPAAATLMSRSPVRHWRDVGPLALSLCDVWATARPWTDAGPVLMDLQGQASWAPYTTKTGRPAWKSTTTGEVRYQQNMPGSGRRGVAGSEQQEQVAAPAPPSAASPQQPAFGNLQPHEVTQLRKQGWGDEAIAEVNASAPPPPAQTATPAPESTFGNLHPDEVQQLRKAGHDDKFIAMVNDSAPPKQQAAALPATTQSTPATPQPPAARSAASDPVGKTKQAYQEAKRAHDAIPAGHPDKLRAASQKHLAFAQHKKAVADKATSEYRDAKAIHDRTAKGDPKYTGAVSRMFEAKGVARDARRDLELAHKKAQKSLERLGGKGMRQGLKALEKLGSGTKPTLPALGGSKHATPATAPASIPGSQSAAGPASPSGAAPSQPDRRQDDARRKAVGEMSPEEMKKELLTSPVTGIPNRRAFDEGSSPAVAMSDADGLKAFNDKFGYDAGNALLKAKAEALKKAGVDAYHEKGDEFLYRGNSPQELGQKLEHARQILKDTHIAVHMKDGTVKHFKGADFSYGHGTDLGQAENGLKQHKQVREARGERARGELRGITEVGSQPDQSRPGGAARGGPQAAQPAAGAGEAKAVAKASVSTPQPPQPPQPGDDEAIPQRAAMIQRLAQQVSKQSGQAPGTPASQTTPTQQPPVAQVVPAAQAQANAPAAKPLPPQAKPVIDPKAQAQKQAFHEWAGRQPPQQPHAPAQVVRTQGWKGLTGHLENGNRIAPAALPAQPQPGKEKDFHHSWAFAFLAKAYKRGHRNPASARQAYKMALDIAKTGATGKVLQQRMNQALKLHFPITDAARADRAAGKYAHLSRAVAWDDGEWLMAVQHSPRGGVNIGGTFFPGGRFIPDAALAQATPQETAKLELRQTKEKIRLKGVQTDHAKLRQDLEPHTTETLLDDKQLGQAKKFWEGLKAHHGELAAHRLHEIARHDLANADPTDRRTKMRLRSYRHMLDWHEEAEKADAKSKAEDKSAEDKPKADATNPDELRKFKGEQSMFGGGEDPPNAAGEVIDKRSGARSVPMGELHVDPERFQYKLKTDTSGVVHEGSALEGVKNFNPEYANCILVWQDPANGKTFVVNGHHRYDLAKRSGETHMNVLYIRPSEARDAKGARKVGALANISEGRGTATDAAKLIRDEKFAPEDFKKAGVSLKGKISDPAFMLAKLSDDLFGKLVSGGMDEKEAVRVARIPNHAIQEVTAQYLKEMRESGEEVTDRHLDRIVQKAINTPTVTKKEASLFGESEKEKNLYFLRTKLEDGIISKLSQEANLFRTVSTERKAKALEKAGNVIQAEESRKIADEAASNKASLEKLVDIKGPVADAFNKAAEDIDREPKKRREIESRLLDEVREAIKKHHQEFLAQGGTPGSGEKAPAGAGDVRPEQGARPGGASGGAESVKKPAPAALSRHYLVGTAVKPSTKTANGDTIFAVLLSLGGYWDGDKWRMPAGNVESARKLIANAAAHRAAKLFPALLARKPKDYAGQANLFPEEPQWDGPFEGPRHGIYWVSKRTQRIKYSHEMPGGLEHEGPHEEDPNLPAPAPQVESPPAAQQQVAEVAPAVQALQATADPARAALIDKIIAAARKPMDNIVESFQLLGTDGKWRLPGGFPLGVQSTGEKRSAGFVFVDKDGSRYGTLGKTREELEQKFKQDQQQRDEAFRTALKDATDEKLQRQVETWIGKPPAKVAAIAHIRDKAAKLKKRADRTRDPELYKEVGDYHAIVDALEDRVDPKWWEERGAWSGDQWLQAGQDLVDGKEPAILPMKRPDSQDLVRTTAKEPWEMGVHEFFKHVEQNPDFAAKFDKKYGHLNDVNWNVYLNDAIKAGKNVPEAIRQEAGITGGPSTREAVRKEVGKAETPQETLQKAAQATSEYEQKHAARLDAAPDGTTITSGQRAFTAETIDGKRFWSFTIRGKYQKHITSREAFVEAGSTPVEKALKPVEAAAPKGRSSKNLLTANQISDFEPGRDRVVRDGDRTFVEDTRGEHARQEIQSDKITERNIENLRNLRPDQLERMAQEVRATPYLSEEGRRERLDAIAKIQGEASASEPAKPAKEPWEITKAEWERSAPERHQIDWNYRQHMAEHEVAVRNAAAEGKKVPAEVLADYPDLAGKATEAIPPNPPPRPDGSFDKEAWDAREAKIADAVKASKEAGSKHLDDFAPDYSVEHLRGKKVRSLRDGSTGTIRTAFNSGDVVVHWDDEQSAKSNSASMTDHKEGRKTRKVWESVVFPGEQSEFVVESATTAPKDLVRHPLDIDQADIWAQGRKRSKYPTLQQSISVKALEGANAIWHHQGDPQQTRFNAAQKDAKDHEKRRASEIDAAYAAGYRFENHRAGKYGTLWILTKDGKVLTERGAKALVEGTGKVDAPKGEDHMANRKELVDKLHGFIESLPESTRENLGSLVKAIDRSPLGEHLKLYRDTNGKLTVSDKAGTWNLAEPVQGHDAEGTWHQQLDSHLPRFLAKIGHMAKTPIPEGEGEWAVHDRAADTEAAKQAPGLFPEHARPASDVIAETPKTKEPWQMTYQEARKHFDDLDTYEEWQRNKSWLETLHGGTAPPAGQKDFTEFSKNHKRAIREAVAAGKHVPDEVIEDYLNETEKRMLPTPEKRRRFVEDLVKHDQRAEMQQIARGVMPESMKGGKLATGKEPWDMTLAEYKAMPQEARYKWHDDTYAAMQSRGVLPKVGDSWTLPDGRQATIHKTEQLPDGKGGLAPFYALDIADHPLRLPETSGGAGKKERYSERTPTDLVLQGWRPGTSAPAAAPRKRRQAESGGEIETITSPGARRADIQLQHEEAKRRHPDKMVLMRNGDFYEAYGEDAENLAKTVGAVLVKRGGVPFAAFPHQVLEGNLRKLLGAGHKVAMAEPVGEEGLPVGSPAASKPAVASSNPDSLQPELESLGYEVHNATHKGTSSTFTLVPPMNWSDLDRHNAQRHLSKKYGDRYAIDFDSGSITFHDMKPELRPDYHELVEQQRTAKKAAQTMPEEAEKVIKATRNKQRKEYAEAYADWKLGGERGDSPFAPSGLSYMAAQAVRLTMDRIFEKK